MYLDALTVRVRHVDRGEDRNSETVLGEWTTAVPVETFLELDDEQSRNELQSFVFDAAGEPPAYSVTIVEKRIEQGSSSAFAEVIVDVYVLAREIAWETFTALVAGYIADNLVRRNDD